MVMAISCDMLRDMPKFIKPVFRDSRMLEKHVHSAIKDGLSFTTRSLLFCLLSALWHIDTLPTETVYNFVSFELSSFENSHHRCDVSVV